MENKESTKEKEKSTKNKTFVTYLELRVLWIPGKEKKTRSTSLREALYHYDAIYQRVLIFACSMSHIRPYLLSSPEAEDDVRDIGKHDFPSVLLQPMLSNANLAGLASQQSRCRMINVAYLCNNTKRQESGKDLPYFNFPRDKPKGKCKPSLEFAI